MFWRVIDCDGKVVAPVATGWKGMWIGEAVSRGVQGAVNDESSHFAPLRQHPITLLINTQLYLKDR